MKHEDDADDAPQHPCNNIHWRLLAQRRSAVGQHGDETLDEVDAAIHCLFGGAGHVAGLKHMAAIPVGGEDPGCGEQVRAAVACRVNGEKITASLEPKWR
jgi:hypothetical protein